MSNKNRVVVKILGQEYPLMSEDDRDYMQKIAYLVDDRMQEIYSANKKLSTTMVAVLTSLNLADDYVKIQDEKVNLQTQVDELLLALKEQDLGKNKTSSNNIDDYIDNFESTISYSDEECTDEVCTDEECAEEECAEEVSDAIEEVTADHVASENLLIHEDGIEPQASTPLLFDVNSNENSEEEMAEQTQAEVAVVDSEEFLFFKQEIEALRKKVDELGSELISRDSALRESDELIHMLEKKLHSSEEALSQTQVKLVESQEELEEFINEFDQAAN